MSIHALDVSSPMGVLQLVSDEKHLLELNWQCAHRQLSTSNHTVAILNAAADELSTSAERDAISLCHCNHMALASNSACGANYKKWDGARPVHTVRLQSAWEGQKGSAPLAVPWVATQSPSLSPAIESSGPTVLSLDFQAVSTTNRYCSVTRGARFTRRLMRPDQELARLSSVLFHRANAIFPFSCAE
jgi:hypothetical protein